MNDRYYQMIDRSYKAIDRSYRIQLQNLNLSSLHDKTNSLQILRSNFFNTLNVRMECKLILFSLKMGFFNA